MALWKREQTWWADVAVDGRRYRESLRTTDKREAKAREKELISRIQAGKVGSPVGKTYARLPFAEAAAIYIQERVDRVAERTIQFEKERLVPLCRHLGGSKLKAITAERIAAYQQARIKEGVSGRTVNMEVAVLGRMLKKGKLWAQMADDITKYPERSNVGRALTQEEKVRLFEMAATNERWMVAYCAAVLAASTTCRGVELKNLNWRDVDLSNDTVRVERSKNEAGRRTIPLNEDAVDVLQRLRERAEAVGADRPEHYVFPACERNQIDPTRHQKTWSSAWNSLTEAAGLAGFRFHDLRHTAITEMAEAGASDATLMAIAGHITREMMEHYSHVRMKAKRDAVKALSTGRMRAKRDPGKAA